MGCWWVAFFCCVLISSTTAALRNAVVVEGGWVDRFVGAPRVRGLRFIFYFEVFFSSRDTDPALA